MIRFSINSEYLDTDVNLSVSFEWKNTVLSFDNLSTSRSLTFSIPKTPNNEKILIYASKPSQYGDMMRYYSGAEMFYDGCHIAGRLYITDFKNNNYTAFFSFGELANLKRIIKKETIDKWLNNNEYILLNRDNLVFGQFSLYSLKIFNYNSDGVPDNADKMNSEKRYLNMLPSYKYKYLLDILANSNGINIDYNGIDRVVSDLCIHSSTARLKAGKIDSMQYGNANYDNDYFNKFTAVQDVAISGAYGQQLIETRYIHAWKANHNVLLSKIPSNCSLIVKKKDEKLYQFITNSSVNGHYLPGPGTIPTDTKTYWQQSLPPTAPLSYQLEQGDYFTIINRSGRWGKSSIGKYYLFFSSGNQPFQSSSFTSVNLGAKYEKDIELEYDDKFYLDSNLPAVTFIDLVKFIAAWSFRFLTWNESTKTLRFEEYSFDKTSAINLDTITIEEQEIKRSIEGFAIKNNIKCKDDTYIRSIYIDNNTLEQEKTISEIKMQALTPEGKAATLYEYYKDGETYKKESTDFAIGDLSTSPTQTQLFIMKGLYDYIDVSDDFVNLFDFSTSIKLKVRFPLYKFLRMKEKQTYLYHGIYYICTSAKWSNGLSELTLVKI